MNFNIEEVNKLIQNRRSVFPPSYNGEEIPRSVIEQILENANWAPTHKGTEPWRFTVFTGEGLDKLGQFQAELYKKVSLEKGTFNESDYKKLRTKPLQASHIISIGMKRDPQRTVPEIEEIEAVACSVQNMHLTATALGLGAYWGTGGITYLDEAKSFFNLGPEDKLLGFFYLGIPKNTIHQGRRGSIGEKVNWVEK